MINLKVLSTVAALALVLPMAAPVESHAAGRGGYYGGTMGGGARFAASRGFARPSVAAAPVGQFGGATAGPRFAGNWSGGWRHRHGGFWPGVAVGAVVGGAIANSYAYSNSYAYYGDSYYYGNNDYYYDDGYYDDSTVAVVPGGGGDDAGYCAQRYHSYDPASGTYLGYDGLRHLCP